MFSVTNSLLSVAARLRGRSARPRKEIARSRPKRWLPVFVVAGALIAMAVASTSSVLAKTPVQVAFTTVSRPYDGTTNATVDKPAGCTLTGVAEGDDVQCVPTNATASFPSKNVGEDLDVTGNGFELTGAQADNYEIASATSSATITQAPLAISAVTDSRQYNGTTSSLAVPSVSGLQGSVDNVTGLAQTFDSKNVGPRTLSVSAGYTVNDGNGGANYDVDDTQTAAGSITQAPLDISAATDSRQYNGTTSSSGVPTLGTDQLQTGDTVTGRVQAFDSKNVGSRTLSVTGYIVNDGNGGANYLVNSSHTATGSISQAPLDIFATSQSRGYNGTAASTAIPTYTVAQVQTGDSVDGLVQVFDSRNAGARTLSVSAYVVHDDNGGLNYAVDASHTAAGSISQALLTVNAITNTKVADGNTSAAAIPTTTGTIYPDDSTTGSFSETYATAAAGFPITLTPAGVVNDDNNGLNYSYTYNTFANGRIRPGPVASLAFTAQPIDTKINTPIYNTCAPGGTPCAASSNTVKVTARDQYGNLAGPGAPGADGTTAAIKVVIQKDTSGGTTIGPNTGTATSNGVASFGSSLVLSGTFTGHLKLYASTSSPATSTTSDDFRIVNDLAPCNAAVCKNNIGNGGNSQNLQYLFGQIKANGTYTATTLTTQFVPENQINNRCGSNNTVNMGVELRATGADVNATSTGYMLMIIPKATLKADGALSRGTPSFNVCLGALFLGDATNAFGSQHAPWNTISGPATERQDTIAVDGDTYYRYWGAPANCGARGLTAQDPCIFLRTKQKSDVTALITQGILSAGADANMKDSDLGIVIKKPSPWDGKGGVY